MKRKVLRGLLPAVLVAMWLTGCGGSGADAGKQEVIIMRSKVLLQLLILIK